MDEVRRPRRVVTGHGAAGQAVIVEDAQVEHAPLLEMAGRPGAVFFQLWATYEMPVDNADPALERQRVGSASVIVGSGSGSVLRLGELAPGTRSAMHRTQSLDYGILLEGECDLELDGGDVVTLHSGDVVVQRGTNHAWHNRSDAPCRYAWILLDARPVVVAGTTLETSWVHEDCSTGPVGAGRIGDVDDPAATLEHLLDRAAIGDLLHEFARRLDGGEWDRYAATFAEDGVFELPWSRRVGRDEIAAAAKADLERFDAVMHYSTNHVIEIDGETARTRSYLVGVHVPDAEHPETHADAGGWYDCELRRSHEGWRFTRVRVTIAWRGGLALPFAPPE